MWIQERCKRLTSSNFGRICKATQKTDFPNLAYSLTAHTKLKAPPITHGHKYESVAVDQFERTHKKSTKKSGLVVSESHPYLAASPDRLLGSDTVIEVKCPYTARDKVINAITVPWLKADGENLQLDTNHNYYFQIQGQLYCTERTKCILVVYTLKDMKCIPVVRNQSFIDSMIDKLSAFYSSFFKQAIIRRFVHRDYYNYSFQTSPVY